MARAMLEQVGDVVREAEPPRVIRLRRHTPKSRAIALVLGIVALAYFGWALVRRARGEPYPALFPVAIVFAFGGRLARRWQIEVLRPGPQTPAHRRAYRRLQVASVSLALVWIAPLLWFVWNPPSSPWVIGGAVFAGFAVASAGLWILKRLYERLFTEIAATEGAYGF